MRFFLPFSSSFLLLLNASASIAVYTDEAYHVDYHHAFLGIPQAHTTFFHRPSANSKASLLYTLSERSILGAVNPKDGSVLWRQQLAIENQSHPTASLLKAGEGANVVVSAANNQVQAWDAVDGRLVWSWQSEGHIKAIDVVAGEQEAKDVLAVSREDGGSASIKQFSISDGGTQWVYRDNSGDLPFSILSSNERIFYLSLHSVLLKGSKIRVTELSSTTGQQVGHSTLISSENEVFSEDSILYTGISNGVVVVVWTDKGLKTLKVGHAGFKQISSINIQPIKGEWPEKVIVHATTTFDAQTSILFHFRGKSSHWAQVYHINPQTGRAERKYEIPQVEGDGAFSTSSQRSEVFFIQHTPLDISLRSSEKATVLDQWHIRPIDQVRSLDLHDVTHAVTEVVSRGSSKFSIRSALVMKAGDWGLIRNGESLWTRPESLAGVAAASFVSVATQASLAEQLAVEGQYNVLGAYFQRLKRHLRGLQHLPTMLKSLTDLTLGNLGLDRNQPRDQLVSSDSFGFRKLVIVATERGRLAALDTGDKGLVIWNVQAVDMQDDDKWDVLSIESTDGSVEVRATNGGLVRCNLTTGEVTKYHSGRTNEAFKTAASVIDAVGQHLLIPVKHDGTLGALPNLDLANRVVVVTIDDDGIVRGWGLIGNARPVHTWQFDPAPGETVRSIVSRPAHDPVASIGKALGDRNVLYKYLHPNVVLITAVSPKDRTATFYLVDSVSGAVIHSTTQNGVDVNQPISSTLSQNFLAYSLFSESDGDSQKHTLPEQQHRGFRLVVSELYESPFPNDRGSLEPSTNTSSIFPASMEGEAAESPYAISLSFIIPGPISHMSMTSTLQGITPASLLCVLPHLNALISIPRYILDPRRPVGRDPTANEVEEGLFKYSALLEFEPKWIVTHMREMLNISKVISIPSNLESTSLLLAYGAVDIFGSRVSPIGGFDILGKGFSKFQLVGTVVALGLGTMLLAPFVRRKQIDAIWKA